MSHNIETLSRNDDLFEECDTQHKQFLRSTVQIAHVTELDVHAKEQRMKNLCDVRTKIVADKTFEMHLQHELDVIHLERMVKRMQLQRDKEYEALEDLIKKKAYQDEVSFIYSLPEVDETPRYSHITQHKSGWSTVVTE